MTVTLPDGRGLLFGMSTLADNQLTVQNAAGETTRYPGSLSADGTSLTFSNGDLQLPGTTVMWVGVGAGHDAPLGASSLTFSVGGRDSRSTTVVVTPAFTVSPGEGQVQAGRAGASAYPGVQVRNNGSPAIPLQRVTATLPADAVMRFGTETNPDHQCTVWDRRGAPGRAPGQHLRRPSGAHLHRCRPHHSHSRFPIGDVDLRQRLRRHPHRPDQRRLHHRRPHLTLHPHQRHLTPKSSDHGT
ncbi:hypothetical protein ABZ765_25360 [Streptomyces pseudogriseolus]|uniref:hypothetical protein n=1 Tax=Streptomyces pseudogriseolus TaxID=36817 RepID=UPI00349AD4CA